MNSWNLTVAMFAVMSMQVLLACGPTAPSPPSEPVGIQNPALVSDYEPTPIAASFPQPADPQGPTPSQPTPSSPDPTSIPSGPTLTLSGPTSSPPGPTPTKEPPNIDYGDPCYPAGGNLFTGNEEYIGPEDIEQFMICYEEMLQYRFGWPHDDILPPIYKAWPTLRAATDGDSAVATARARVVSCLADKGHTDIPDKLLFYWQDFADPETLRMRLETLTKDERRLMRLVARPTDECALEHGYYLTQSDAWRQLVNPIVDADTDHDLVDALAISNIHFLLWLPGTVHMLTLDGALPLVQIGDIENVPPPGGVAPPLTVDQITPEPIPSHPEGIAGCKGMNLFADDLDIDYMDWCQQEAERQIHEMCADQNDRVSCASDYFSDWLTPGHLRRAECAIYSEQWELAECAKVHGEASFKALGYFGEEWAAVLSVVNMDPSVVGALHDAKRCLTMKGITDFDDRFLYYWQDYVWRPHLYEAFIAGLSGSEVAQLESLRVPSQQCGDQEGFFTAQETAFIEELERLQVAEPEKIASLQYFGLLAALKEPGVIRGLSKE